MALFLDSANLEEVRQGAALSFVAGLTTNPTLMARETAAPLEQLAKLVQIFPGPVCYQLMETEVEAMLKEGREASTVARDKVILKIPCTLNGLTVAAQLKGQIPCAITAVYTPQQAWLAAQTGALYAIPYINRTMRLGGDPLQLVRQMSTLLRNSGSKTEIMAASLKSFQEAVATLEAGAHHLTLPLDMIKGMAEHEWTRQAVEDFARAAGEKKSQKQAPAETPRAAEKQPPKAQPKAEAAPPAESRSTFNEAPFTMLDYIMGKIKLEELVAGVGEQELREYLAQRELDKLKEEEEVNARLEELKKKLGK